MPKTPTHRQTKAREAVEQILSSYTAPIALSELHLFIKRSLPKTAFSTIFRIVQRLEAEQKIIRIDWRERGSRYEWADLPHHHHLTCQLCGKIVDIDDELLAYAETKISQKTGFKIKHHSIELEGICQDCQVDAKVAPKQ